MYVDISTSVNQDGSKKHKQPWWKHTTVN